MSAAAILERLKASGVHIRAEGANLRVGPREAVTPETLELIREHKAELLKVVSPLPPGLENAIRRMAEGWGATPDDLEVLLEKARQDPAGSWSLIAFNADPNNYPGRLQ